MGTINIQIIYNKNNYLIQYDTLSKKSYANRLDLIPNISIVI